MKIEEAISLILSEVASQDEQPWSADLVTASAVVIKDAGELVKTTLNKDNNQQIAAKAIYTAASAIRFLKHLNMEVK
jgi:hypothetical protein